MQIDKETLQEIATLYDGEVFRGWKVVLIEHVDNSRWSQIYEQVIQDTETGKFYRTNYSIGSTEMQDESPYEYDADMIEVQEVVPQEITKTIYVNKGK